MYYNSEFRLWMDLIWILCFFQPKMLTYIIQNKWCGSTKHKRGDHDKKGLFFFDVTPTLGNVWVNLVKSIWIWFIHSDKPCPDAFQSVHKDAYNDLVEWKPVHRCSKINEQPFPLCKNKDNVLTQNWFSTEAAHYLKLHSLTDIPGSWHFL